MAKAEMQVFEHEKLGEITFKKGSNGRPVYDNLKIQEIFLKGIESLVNQDLLTPKDSDRFKDIINDMEIGYKKNLVARTSMPYKYNRQTGEVVNISFFISEMSLYIPIKGMIESILDNLCQIIVIFKYPKDKLRELEKYELDDGLNGHGGYWIKYAEALLPEECITYYKIAYKARDYILKNATTDQMRAFSEQRGEDWVVDLAGEYAERLVDEEMTEKDYSIKDFMEDELLDYEDEDDECEDDTEGLLQSDSPVSLEAYIKDMEVKYEDELKSINEALIMVSSYQRGALLFEVIENCKHEELKYYLFFRKWGRIDKGHELYTPSLVSKWLNNANVQLDLSGLELEEEFVTVYRGENEYSLPWKKGALSWTTSKEIAEKFARGVRLRIQDAAKPRIVMGKVHKYNILARFDGRQEFELLCRNVVFLNEEKLQSNSKNNPKKAKSSFYVVE